MRSRELSGTFQIPEVEEFDVEYRNRLDAMSTAEFLDAIDVELESNPNRLWTMPNAELHAVINVEIEYNPKSLALPPEMQAVLDRFEDASNGIHNDELTPLERVILEALRRKFQVKYYADYQRWYRRWDG